MVLTILNINFVSQVWDGVSIRISDLFGSQSNAVRSSIFYTTTTGIAVLLGGAISVFFLIKRIHYKLSAFYLIMFVPVMISLYPPAFPFLSFILPSRSLVLCSLVSWIMIALLINHYSTDLTQFSTGVKFLRSLNTKKWRQSHIIVVLLIFLIFAPSLISNFTFEQANKFSWFTRSGFDNDYDVLLWAHRNINANDTILDDFSFTSWYLESFSVKDTTSVFWSRSDFKIDRARAALDFIRNPENSSMLIDLIHKYSIKYILVTSEWGYYVWNGVGGNNQYVKKPYSPAQYKAILNYYPFLKLVTEKGNAGIYEVLPFKIEQKTALEFGNSSSVMIQHNETIMPSNQLTISTWIKPEQLATVDSYLLSKKYNGYELSWRWNNRLALLLNWTIVIESNKVFNSTDLNKWWHVTVVYNTTQASVYINGKLDSTSQVQTGLPSNTEPLYLGCRNSTTPYGFAPPNVLRELRIYSSALSAAEIEQLYKGNNIDDGLVLHFAFSEGAGTKLHDLSEFHNDGLISGAKWTTYDVIVVDSVAYDF